jgi:hypothetical protein
MTILEILQDACVWILFVLGAILGGWLVAKCLISVAGEWGDVTLRILSKLLKLLKRYRHSPIGYCSICHKAIWGDEYTSIGQHMNKCGKHGER